MLNRGLNLQRRIAHRYYEKLDSITDIHKVELELYVICPDDERNIFDTATLQKRARGIVVMIVNIKHGWYSGNSLPAFKKKRHVSLLSHGTSLTSDQRVYKEKTTGMCDNNRNGWTSVK